LHSVEPSPEILAVEELHGDVGDAGPLAGVENVDHMRAAKLSGNLRFARETNAHLFALRLVVVDELQRAARVEEHVLCEPDRSHPAGAELAHQPVASRDLDALNAGEQCPALFPPSFFRAFASSRNWLAKEPDEQVRACRTPSVLCLPRL